MAVAKTLQNYLKLHKIHYQLVAHPHTGSSMESAQQAHISGDALAKGILVSTAKDGYRLVVVPSDFHIELEALERIIEQPLEMATEAELGKRFPDCEVGAVPPLGDAYGITTLWDPSTSLGSLEWVYFESGDHEHLIEVSGKQFHELMAAAERGHFSHHI
jgi:Ala-tRNA(Pro) deacylase